MQFGNKSLARDKLSEVIALVNTMWPVALGAKMDKGLVGELVPIPTEPPLGFN